MLRIFVLACALVVAPLAVAATTPRTDASAEPRIPYKQSDESAAGLVLRVAGGLTLVLLLGVGAAFVLKRYMPTLQRPLSSGPARINVLEIRRLTPKISLFLVELDGVTLLLGQNGEQVSTLYQDPRRSGEGSHDRP
jgi:flagellar biogenesis protein FliO